MARSLKSGILITGDASGAVKAVKLTREEMSKLNATSAKAKKRTSKHAGELDRLSKIANVSAKALTGLGVAGAAAMGAILRKSIAVSEQYERMQLRTEALIQATGGAAQLSSKQLLKLSEDVALNTLQSVEGVSKAINVMQTFRSVAGTTFKQAIVLSADLATVMGGDITSSAKQLGKALEDPIRGVTALRESGVSFSVDQQEMIKSLVETGKQAEAQRIILAELEKQVGGVGQSEAQGLSGSYDTLGQKLDELALAFDRTTGAGETWKSFVDRMAKGVDEATKLLNDNFNALTDVESAFARALDLQIEIQRLEEQGTRRSQAQATRLRNERIKILELLGREVEAEQERAKAAADAHQKLLDRQKAESDAKAQVAAQTQQATEDQEALNAAVAEFDKAFERVEEEIKRNTDAQARLRKEREANIKANGLHLETLEEEYELMLLSDRERYIQINLRKLNADATAEEIARIEELSGAIYDQANASDDYAKAWENAIERIDAAFADAWKGAFDSFDDFADSLLDAFKDLAGEIAHINITKPITDQLAGVFSGSGGLNLGLSGLFGGSGASAGKGGQSVVGADAALGQGSLSGALQGGFLGALGGLSVNALSTIFDDNASNARRRNNLAALTGGLGFLLPSSIFGKPTDSTQKATYDLSTGVVSDAGSLTGDKFSQQNRDAADYAALVAYNLADYLQGKTGNSIADSLGLVVGNRDGIRAEINGNEIARGTDAGAVLSTLTDELLRLSGISGEVYKALSQDGEELYQTLVRVDDQFVVVSAITDKLHLNFGALGDAGLTASDALVQAAGGLESLVAKTDYYYQNFYSEEERLQNIIDNSTGALAEFNASMGTTIDDRGGLREFVDALDLTTEAGQAAYAAALDLAPTLVDLGLAEQRLAEITGTTKGELVEMETQSHNLSESFEGLSDAMKKLTAQANDFAGGIARDAVLEGLSGYERDVFLLDEWKTQAIEQLQGFTDQGVAILGGPEKVLADIERIYALRLSGIVERYTQSVVVVDEFIESTDNLGDSISNVIDLSDYLAELERQRTDAINDVVRAYERESSVLSNTADKFSKFALSLREFDQSLLIGDLSTLNPEQQYQEAKYQFETLAKQAQLGDEYAISQLQGAASSFLGESREFQGSAGSYARDFDSVRAVLASTISLSDRQASNAEQQLTQLKTQVSEIVSLKEEVKTLKEAIATLVQVEREAGNAMIQQQQQTNQTLNGIKSNSDLSRAAG